ncbi:MAG: NlpC/P60 family protein [Bacteroidetes bacterium]|nr:MAG: NlpC/P60 family protein [Bacteroidota bacterium]
MNKWVHHKKLLCFKHLTAFGVAVILLTACGSTRRATHTSPNPKPSAASAASALKTKYAKLLGVPAQALTNTALYTFIDQWINTPYLYGGQTKKGMDCSGFTHLLFATVYGKSIARQSAAQSLLVKTPKSMADLAEGDLVFFKTEGSKTINHVGLYLHNQKMISATTSAGVTISDIGSSYWKPKYVMGGSVK